MWSLWAVCWIATIDVAVPTSFNGDLDLVVGHIDMGADNYDCRKAQSFALQLPDGYTNLSNVDIVTASFDTQDYVSKIVNVSDIRVVNVPQGKKITSRTETIYNVELLGPADRIAMLDTLVEKCRERGIKTIRGYYYPTAKNKMVKDLYGTFGFEKISEDEAGNTVWQMEVAGYEKKNHAIAVSGNAGEK